MKRRLWIIVLLLLLVLAALVLPDLADAQDDSCPTSITEALEEIDEICGGLRRNQACFGNPHAEVLPRNPEERVQFQVEGDRVPLDPIDTIFLGPYNPIQGYWGIVPIKAQMNLPDTLPGQNVTMVLFGNNTELISESEDWTMFRLQSGFGNSPCEELPDSGLLIQTPDDASQQVAFQINGTPVEIGSTAFFQAESDEQMSMALLDGTGSAGGQEMSPGMRVLVPLEGLEASGPPSEPVPFDDELFRNVERMGVFDQLLDVPGVSGSAGVSQEPCVINTNQRVPYRTGPDEYRYSVFRDLMIRNPVRVMGTDASREWWRVFQDDIPGGEMTLQLWTAVNLGLSLTGNCDPNIMEVHDPAAPVPLPQPPPPGPVPGPQPEQVGDAVINFTASPTTIGPGQCSNVAWYVENIREVLYQGQGVTGSESRNECPSETTSYSLVVVLRNGTQVTRQVTVNVSGGFPAPQPQPGAQIQFWADNSSLELGQCTTLRWNVSNIREVYYQGEGAVGQGSRLECPSQTTTYTLRVIKTDGGTEERQVTVAVTGGYPGPAPTQPKTVRVTVSWTAYSDIDLSGSPYGGSHSGDVWCGNISGSYHEESVSWTNVQPGSQHSGTVSLFDPYCGSDDVYPVTSWTLRVYVDNALVHTWTGSMGSSGQSETRYFTVQ